MRSYEIACLGHVTADRALIIYLMHSLVCCSINLFSFTLYSYISEWNGTCSMSTSTSTVRARYAWDITKHNNTIHLFIQANSSSPPQTQPTPWR